MARLQALRHQFAPVDLALLNFSRQPTQFKRLKMFAKFAILSTLCVAALATSSSDESGHNTVVHHGYPSPTPKYAPPPPPAYKPTPKYHAPAPKYALAPKYASAEDDAKYQFIWQAKASGPVEDGYGKSSHESAELGHTETRDYGKTTGKYWVQLPDGRLQTVEYIVDGDSGYLAKVSYSGNEKPAY